MTDPLEEANAIITDALVEEVDNWAGDMLVDVEIAVAAMERAQEGAATLGMDAVADAVSGTVAALQDLAETLRERANR